MIFSWAMQTAIPSKFLQFSIISFARFHTARRDDKGLATSITTWRQTKVEAEAWDEEGAGGDDVEAGDEGTAGDEGEAGYVKALAEDKEGDVSHLILRIKLNAQYSCVPRNQSHTQVDKSYKVSSRCLLHHE